MTQLTAQEVLSQLQASQSLRQAELSGIDLSGQSVDEGDFIEACLRRANFTQASCQGTNFSGATLIMADFQGAD